MKVSYFLLILVIASCRSDEVIPDGKKIISIRYSQNPLGLLPKAQEWQEKMVYDASGKLIKNTGRYDKRYTLFEYDKFGRVAKRIVFNETTASLLTRDSITYTDESAKVDKITNGGIVYKYFYDVDGNAIQRETYFTSTNETIRMEKYYWENGNVERREVFRYKPEKFLAYEFFYQYDTKINYKKNFPIYIEDPLSQTTNNVTSEVYNDYYGDWDTYCNPCTTEYRYNASSLPYIIKASWGSRIEIAYE